MAKSRRWAYFFGNGKADGRGDQKDLLGGKGAGLAEMTRIGLPVPPGFTITTEACAVFHERTAAGRAATGRATWPDGLEKQVRLMMAKLERASRKKFGDPKRPLLVSVRSGAARSMPGMMETILNLGLNDVTLEGLATLSGNRRFALDAYRRLIMMYGSTARHVERSLFDHAFDELKQTRTRSRLGRSQNEKVLDTDVSAEELEQLVRRFKEIYREHTAEEFPQDPFTQLRGAIDAVFNSWMAEKAVTYRRVENITGLAGTAVNVCQMVFGNMGDDSGTGVCFTRDPSTGENTFYGDLLINAQGEDVVAGVRTPIPLAQLEGLMPQAYEQLEAVRVMLEVHYKDMQDIEFTIERGKLYMLQCRTGKRSPQATFKIAVDQATKGLMLRAEAGRLAKKRFLPKKYVQPAARPVITQDEAIQRIAAVDIERLFYPVLDPDLPHSELSSREIGSGIGAVPGAAAGEIVFSAEEAERRAQEGARVILVRKETSPEDVGGMHAAAGILTATGGKTSHAAVVARGWGKCCIVGCDALSIDYQDAAMSFNGRMLREGDAITLDGNTGRVFEGQIKLVRPEAPPEFNTLLTWCDARRRLRVRANADTPEDAIRAVELGAEGIGLCRTEHMFFDAAQPQRIRAVREMILAGNTAARQRALKKLLPFQIEDFVGIFRAMGDRPVTIRLIDPPLHEFLPQRDNVAAAQALAEELNAPLHEELSRTSLWDTDGRRAIEAGMITVEEIHRRVEALHEANPMLGHRGCRLCITFPEILDVQVTAIVEAALRCAADGVAAQPEIMIPLSIDPTELAILINRTKKVADRLISERGGKLKYLVGTMIETPRAAILAGPMAKTAEFFSFGTNDMTQLVMGLSRDDATRFLPAYLAVPPAATAPLFVSSAEGSEPAESIENRQSTIDHGTRIFADDPFQSLDAAGVGALMQMACEQGRGMRRDIKLGICGEHGGDPKSVRFCESVGLDYVSCSPFRVPIARLAAAQAAIESDGGRRTTQRKPRASRPLPSNKRAKSANRTPARASGGKTAARKRVSTRRAKKSPTTANRSRNKGTQSRAGRFVAKRSARRQLVTA